MAARRGESVPGGSKIGKILRDEMAVGRGVHRF